MATTQLTPSHRLRYQRDDGGHEYRQQMILLCG